MNSNRPAAVPLAVRRAQRTKRNLVALGSAAVLAVYAAGYWRTAAAASAHGPRLNDRLASSEKKRIAGAAEKTKSAVGTGRLASPSNQSSATPAVTPTYQDGVYTGWGHCRHGDLQSSVTIKDGRIVDASISECYTRYSKNVIAKLPPQVVVRQGPNVDWISGATESSEAYSDATLAALIRANK